MPTSATGARPLSERGFTLVELMVTLAILAVLLALFVAAALLFPERF